MFLSLEAVEEPIPREEVTTPVVFTLPVIDNFIAEWNATHPEVNGTVLKDPGRNGTGADPEVNGTVTTNGSGAYAILSVHDDTLRFLLKTGYGEFPKPTAPIPPAVPTPLKKLKERKVSKEENLDDRAVALLFKFSGQHRRNEIARPTLKMIAETLGCSRNALYKGCPEFIKAWRSYRSKDRASSRGKRKPLPRRVEDD
jgi:hypothetical protein